MHKLIQWLRYLIACGFSGMAIGFAVKEQSILGILGVLCCLLPAIGLFLPLTFKVRGQVGFPPPGVPLKELFSWYWILAGCRWFLGLCYCCATLGGLFKHEYPAALTLFAIGLIFITPLDRLFFPRLYFHVKPILRTRRIQILILRNTAIGFHAIAFDQYSQPPYGTSLANFLLCIAAILLAAAAWITPKDLLLPEEEDLSIPALVKTIVKPVANQVEEPVIIQAVSGDSKISQESYQDAYEVLKGLKTSYSFSPERFSKLITAFQTDWLKAKRFRERLNIHRNPIEVKNQTITELETYLLRIQGRSEMRDIDPDTKAQGYVPTRVADIWMADKRIRSLYDAVKEYCSLQRKDFFITAVHIAEYRAMVKLLKRIRRLVTSQQMAGKQDNFQGAGGEDLESSNLKIVLQGSIDMKKMAQEVALSLSSLVPTSSVGAPTVRESISSLGDKVYFQIIDYIIMLGKNLENYKDLNEKFNEEGYRDYFLPFLNAVSPHYSAKGEAFNRKGKTDILIFDDKGTNIFIAECKLWKGEAYLLSAVDQLLNNYVNWRDEKTAIIVFNRDTKKFSELILKATKAIARHPLCDHGAMDKRNDASWSYFFRHPDDEDRKIRLELVLLNFA